MEKAKAAVSDFMSKAGKHDTTVHETVAPSVQHETVKSHQHENVTTAVDKEVHQDHYHRTVQPVQDREVLPEQHHAKLGSVQHREFDHRDAEGTKQTLAQDQEQFRDQRVEHDTTHSQSAAPAIGGEHVHHHIHETIQPVVHKETIQPSVVHTTVPIHETHHNAAKHHETSTLPTVSMNEFKNKGGVLGGREERYDGFEGQPKNIGGALSGMTHSHGKHDSHHGTEHGLKEGMHGNDRLAGGDRYDERRGDQYGTDGRTGTTGGAGGLERAAERGLEHERAGNNGMGRTGGAGGLERAGERGLEHERSGHTGAGALESGHKTGDYSRGQGYDDTTTQKTKPSMMDKLNPSKDSDGDGKAGFMK